YPMDLIASLHAGRWLLGNQACTLYRYVIFIVEAGMFHAHALIALNRTWALVRPHSYRTIHSTRTAMGFCAAVWVYLHLTMVPEFVIETVNYRLPVEK